MVTTVRDGAQEAVLESLPDDILVAIGLFVGEACTIGEFVRFASTSKRLKRLLLDSEAMFARLVLCRKSVAARLFSHWVPPSGQPKQFQGLRLQHPPRTPPLFPLADLRTPEDLYFYERFYLDYRNLFRIRSCPRQIVGGVLTGLLRDFPSASIVMEVHSSHREGRVAAALAMIFTQSYGVRLERIVPAHLQTKIKVRVWGQTLGRVAPDPDHFLTIVGIRYWSEIYVQLPRTGSQAPLELPPRPNYYEGISLPTAYRNSIAVQQQLDTIMAMLHVVTVYQRPEDRRQLQQLLAQFEEELASNR